MTTSRLLFAALLLAAAPGCARERVAYEVRLTREPVRRSYRAPRAHQEVVVRYAHGADRHRCDATCEEFWPDVYQHGQAEHRCDGTCPSYAPPRPQRRSVTVDHVQSFTSPSSTTRVSAGVSTAFDVEPYDAYPTSSRVVVYAHGHARHRCAASCASYYPLPGRHVSVTVYGHGHRSHRCHSGCASYRAPVQVVFSHGHASHRCHSGCSSWRAPVQVVFGHGHSSHRCHSGCGSWQVDERWSRRRGGVVVFGHGHAGHVCASGCGHYAPRHYAPHVDVGVSRHHRHGRSWSGAGVSVGSDGVRFGIGFGSRWSRRR